MMKRLLIAAAVSVTSALLSFTAINRSLDRVDADERGEPAAQSTDGAAVRSRARPLARIPEIGLTSRPNDIIRASELSDEVAVCPAVTTEDVSDALLARTKFGSRSAVASFLRTSNAGYNAMRRVLLPEFIKAASTIRSCYRPEPDDQAVVYLGIHIRSGSGSAAVVDASVLRIDAPAESHGLIQNCLVAFKAGKLPISVRAPEGDVFAQYDDFYLKEVPLALGPKSIEHMLALRKAAKQKQISQSGP
jgi:hypothetical protein